MKYSNTKLTTGVMFALNQLGSVVFLYNLKDASLSNSVPVSNAISLIASALTSAYFFGEKIGTLGVVGILLATLGLFLCNI
nr:unnamed protein product [Spirometra erinaceieuropaei]